ncbi:WD repeat-containing protein 44 isoform X1 [Salvia hispanica]|uniref:WD repeat-containing protein 44 isoform X1 n=1 Tax=Salvia hispanica TaxID=49212 RepID=UPI0020094FDC|nr:WD repeat-containing protein 44 isoform X1 [Salvia hispanica]
MCRWEKWANSKGKKEKRLSLSDTIAFFSTLRRFQLLFRRVLCNLTSTMRGGGAEDQFFDTCDESTSDLGSDCSEICVNSGADNRALEYEFWTKEPGSVNERRETFLRWMGLSLERRGISDAEDEDSDNDDVKRFIERLRDDGESVLANLDADKQFFSSGSLQSCDTGGAEEESLTCQMKVLGNGTESVSDELTDDEYLSTSLDISSDKMISLDEFQKTLGSSSLVQKLLTKECKKLNIVDRKKKTNWLQKFSSVIQIVDKAKGLLNKTEIDSTEGPSGRVRVSACKKNLKELSSLYTGQEFPAHEGSILTMKFSPDGMYLASAGVDGVVRVWKVLEDDIVKKFSLQDSDPSCVYFSLDGFCKLAPLDVPTGDDHTKNMIKSSDSACVVLPPKVFQLSEKPLHEFNGHKGEVLALAWSKNGHLLSSSVDKTARLWRVGDENCQGVYSHNNYVTCVEFNPVDDNNFISGSIDGKLRIWEVHGGRVIDWTDFKEIVTAVGYRPDGKGGVVGSMEGTCRFYDIIDNRLQLGDSICLKGKKKLAGKKITGFQYCPTDVSKVMVTCADAQVQILCGTNVVCKFKSNRSSTSQMPAAFTSDGEHVVSATEDSNVRVWNYSNQEQKPSRAKKIWSCESFLSRNASVAIPWCGGLKHKLGGLPGSIHFDEKLLQKLQASIPMSVGNFLDALYKGAATWPEEKLPLPSVCKSDFKFLRNAWQNAFNSPNLWGLVIVTAGWDGCIRTFLNYGLPIKF